MNIIPKILLCKGFYPIKKTIKTPIAIKSRHVTINPKFWSFEILVIRICFGFRYSNFGFNSEFLLFLKKSFTKGRQV